MDPRTGLLMIRALVEKQANDEGLWFITPCASEQYLMDGLRELHALIERVIDAVAKADERADLCDRHGNQMIWPEEQIEEVQDALLNLTRQTEPL